MINFARKLGSKNKNPRRRRALQIGAGLVGVGLTALGGRKVLKTISKNKSLAKKALNSNKVVRRRNAIEEALKDGYKRSNSGAANLVDEKRLRTSKVSSIKRDSAKRIKRATSATKKNLGSNYSISQRLSAFTQ